MYIGMSFVFNYFVMIILKKIVFQLTINLIYNIYLFPNITSFDF